MKAAKDSLIYFRHVASVPSLRYSKHRPFNFRLLSLKTVKKLTSYGSRREARKMLLTLIHIRSYNGVYCKDMSP